MRPGGRLHGRGARRRHGQGGRRRRRRATSGTRGLAAGPDVRDAVDFSAADALDPFETLHATVETLRDCDAVTVCACGAYAVGAGPELALGCDLRVATAEAALGLTEVDVGLPAVSYGSLLPPFVGYGDAAELVFLGDPFSGTRAAAAGPVHEAPPEDEYAETVAAYVDALAMRASLENREPVWSHDRDPEA